MAKIDTSSAFADAEAIEVTADDELHLDDEPLEPEAKATDPIDIFGDLGLTGQGDLERGMVPDVMFDFAQDASGRIGLNPGSIAIPMISTAAVSIRHGWKVQPKLKDYTWKEKPAVWIGITGPSGVNKSAALDVGLEPLEKEEEHWAKQNAELMEEHILQKEEHKIVLKAWRDALKEGGRKEAGDMPRPPKIPKRKRAIIENSTMEQLIQIASENPDGLIQYKDELVGWIASFDAYSGGGKGGASQDRAAALSGYNGRPASKDRVGAQGSGGTHIRANCFSLNVVGGIQDSKVREVLSKGGSDGLMARFLFVEARPADGGDWTPDKRAIQRWGHVVRNLLRIKPEEGCKTVFRMSPEAAKVGADLRQLRRQLQLLPIPTGLNEHISKWDGMWARICMIFHMVELASKGADGSELTPDDLEILADPAGRTEISEATAIQVRDLLTKFLLPEAVRIYTEVVGQEDQTAHARWIADHILAHGLDKISVYDIGRAYKALKGDHMSIKRAMESLELLAWVKPAGKRASIGDFGKMKWTVNPRCHEIFAARAEAERQRRAEATDKIRKALTAAKTLRD